MVSHLFFFWFFELPKTTLNLGPRVVVDVIGLSWRPHTGHTHIRGQHSWLPSKVSTEDPKPCPALPCPALATPHVPSTLKSQPPPLRGTTTMQSVTVHPPEEECGEWKGRERLLLLLLLLLLIGRDHGGGLLLLLLHARASRRPEIGRLSNNPTHLLLHCQAWRSPPGTSSVDEGMSNGGAGSLASRPAGPVL